MFVFLLCQSPSSIPQPRCAWSFGYDPKPFRKNSPRWPPANPPPHGAKGSAPCRSISFAGHPLEVHRDLRRVFHGLNQGLSRGKPPGVGRLRGPPTRDILFVCSKARFGVWERFWLIQSHMIFPDACFLEGVGLKVSFILDPPETGEKRKLLLLQLGCLRHGPNLGQLFPRNGTFQATTRNSFELLRSQLQQICGTLKNNVLPRKTNMTSWKITTV